VTAPPARRNRLQARITLSEATSIPAGLPPSFKGKNVQIKREAFAGTDIPGWFDPASSWQEVTVK